MRKLCVDARMINSSGIGTYLQNLLPYFKSAFKLILLGDKNEIAAFPKLADVEVIHFTDPIYSIKEQLHLPGIIPVCDVFYTPHYNIPLLPIRAKKRVVSIHDIFHLAFFNQLTFSQKVYAKLVINGAAKISDLILTLSEFSKSEIIKHTGVKEKKIHVVYLAVDLNFFKTELNIDAENLRAKYGLGRKYILFVGNVKPNKNLKALIEAFKLLIKDPTFDSDLVIVGKKEGFITKDQALFDTLEKNSELNQRVHFTGFVENNDLPGIYSLASMLCFPSKYEGFGLPPLEAMASGCPTIVSSAASLPEACGKASIYINPDNPSEIAKAISQLSNSDLLRKELIFKGLEQVQKFNWDLTASKTIKLLQSV